MDHSEECDHAHCTQSNASVSQTISEMDWERGLWYAAFYGDEDRLKELIIKSRNIKKLVNIPDNAGYTPLHYAARKGYINICQILLQYGAKVDARTKSGLATPLHKAAVSGKKEVIQFLIEFGAQIDAQDADGQTVLHKAAENKHLALVKYLTDTFHELADMKDNKGQTVSDYLSNQNN